MVKLSNEGLTAQPTPGPLSSISGTPAETSGGSIIPGAAPEEGEAASKRLLRQKAADVRRWAEPTQGMVFIFPSYEWWNNIVPVASVDHARRTIALAGDCSYEIKPEDRYYVMGLLEELDAPGEWCVDAAGETLCFWPPSPLEDRPVYVPTTRTILQLDGAKNVTVHGLTLECCDGTAVTVVDSEACHIAGCTIRNVGDYGGNGVSVSGGTGNGVVGCDIHDVGCVGIALSGGDQETLTPAGNYAENNHITRTGVFYKQGSGIAVSGVGNRVSRNTIHHVPRWCVKFGGNNNIIELNHLHHASLETSDTGAIYGGSANWLSSHGTIIRHNYIHDIVGCGRRKGEWRSPFYTWGIYLDWSATGVTIHGNIIARCPRAGIMVHDGRFNTISNDIIVDCGIGEHDSGSQIEFRGWHDMHSFWIQGRHRFGWDEQYESVANQPKWHREGSTLRDPRHSALPDGRTMHTNALRRNILHYPASASRAFRFHNISFEHNPSDHNLVWCGGQPVKTGLVRLRETTGPNLVPNAGFEEGAPDAMPPGWAGQAPCEGASIGAVTDAPHAGTRCLQLHGVSDPSLEGRPDWERQVMAQTRFITTVVPGKGYRAAVWMRANEVGTPARLEALSSEGGVYDVRWIADVSVGTEWREHEVVFRFPQPGDGNHHDGMDQTFYLRIFLLQDAGALWLDDAELREATVMDEWESWQSEGMDRNSAIAHPLFVNAATGDYRLRSGSPALKLGFEQLPVERMGLYDSPDRASCPVDDDPWREEHLRYPEGPRRSKRPGRGPPRQC